MVQEFGIGTKKIPFFTKNWQFYFKDAHQT